MERDGSMATLPDEIIENILLLLPVKSLLRFRCVCKAWLALISASDFAAMHCRQPQTQARTRVLISSPGRLIQSIDPDSPGNDNNGVVNINYPLESPNTVVQILDSCNGLLCVVDFSLNPALWNPSTRQLNPLPSPNSLQNCEILYGFTYDHSTDDYKILRLGFLSLDAVRGNIDAAVKTEIDVFELRANRWRRVREAHFSRPTRKQGTFYKGAFCWAGWRPLEGYVGVRRMIVSFNLKEERFEEVELPSQVGIINLKVFGGYLFAMCHDFHGGHTKMWVMDETAGKYTWANVVSWPRLCRFANCLKNGEEVLMVINKSKLILYDLKTRTPKYITLYGNLRFSIPVLYTETLVSPHSINERGEDI